MNLIFKVFRYIENLWIGRDGKPSIKTVIAIALSVNFISNLSFAIHKWGDGKSLSDLALLLGIEAGLITALLGLKAYANVQQSIIENKNVKNKDTDYAQGPME